MENLYSFFNTQFICYLSGILRKVELVISTFKIIWHGILLNIFLYNLFFMLFLIYAHVISFTRLWSGVLSPYLAITMAKSRQKNQCWMNKFMSKCTCISTFQMCICVDICHIIIAVNDLSRLHFLLNFYFIFSLKSLSENPTTSCWLSNLISSFQTPSYLSFPNHHLRHYMLIPLFPSLLYLYPWRHQIQHA